MNPSIKRLLGAVLLIGTLGVSSIMAVRTSGAVVEHTASGHSDPVVTLNTRLH